jgi:DNA-binding MarR family transcriptional regulator
MPKQHYRADTFHLQDSIGYLVKRTQRLMLERVEQRFASHGYTFQQWVVLMHLRDGLAQTIADLSRVLNHDSGAMTRLIDQLEERGLIERRRSAEDRRVVELHITPAGLSDVEAMIPLAVDMLNDVLDGFTRGEVKQLKSMLRRIATRVQELDAAATVSSAAEEHTS